MKGEKPQEEMVPVTEAASHQPSTINHGRRRVFGVMGLAMVLSIPGCGGGGDTNSGGGGGGDISTGFRGSAQSSVEFP